MKALPSNRRTRLSLLLILWGGVLAAKVALTQAKEERLASLALVGMGCQTSSPPVMWDRKAGKVSRPFLFNIGLLCSKTFDDAIFPELFEAKYGLKKLDMVKMNF